MFKIYIFSFCVVAALAGPSPQVIRPCKFSDIACIRDNLAANSKCTKRVVGSVPAEYTISSFKFDTPNFNATYIDKNLVVRNHHKCVVSEFFFNIKTDTAVLTLDCPLLEFESDRKLLQHVTASEDNVFNYHIRGVYPLIRFTLNLPSADRLNICSAYVFADVTALPTFRVDPIDKPTANFLSKDLSYLNIFERETFYFRAPFLARFFINSVICDFGCNK